MFLWRSALAWPTLMLVLVLAAAALAEPEPEPRRGRGRGRERERSNTVRNGHHRDTNRAGKSKELQGGGSLNSTCVELPSPSWNILCNPCPLSYLSTVFSLFSIVNFNNVGCTSTSALTQG